MRGCIEEIEARFIIGADGDVSVVRKAINPDLEEKIRLVMQYYYCGTVDLPMDYYHFFLIPGLSLRSATCHMKDHFIIVSVNWHPNRSINDVHRKFVRFLEENYCFNGKLKKAEGCLRTSLTHKDIEVSKKNVLLVGDAMLLKNALHEGITTAILTGVCAANAIVKANETSSSSLPYLYERYYSSVARYALLSEEIGERLMAKMKEEMMDLSKEFGILLGKLLWHYPVDVIWNS